MKRVPFWVITFSFSVIALSFASCQRQDPDPVPKARPLLDQTSEVQDILGNQAQEALDVITRDNERQQTIEALHLQQQKDPVSSLPGDGD